jgi:hypothetical protein
MQKQNARLPEGKTSALDSANANTAAHLVRGLVLAAHPLDPMGAN